MAAEEWIEVTTETVGCDGGGGALGHPMVYLKIDTEKTAAGAAGTITCPYCSRRYVLRANAAAETGH